MSFAENLKQLRKDKHLSQEELADILAVSRQAVSKWEQGIGYPEVENHRHSMRFSLQVKEKVFSAKSQQRF